MEQNAGKVTERCKELASFWSPRNSKSKQWYRLIQSVDELKTEKMESFVGNDPRSMYNLILHLLDAKSPYRLKDIGTDDNEFAGINESVGRFLDEAWYDNEKRFRLSGPRQSLSRTIIGFLLATGWYAVFAVTSDDGTRVFIEPLHPMQVFPMWDYSLGLSEVARVYPISVESAELMARRNGWNWRKGGSKGSVVVYDYWWKDYSSLTPQIWNAVVIGDAPNGLVKFSPTRFKRIPIYVAPVGGLPDTGPLSTDSPMSTGFGVKGDRWKEEVGQSIIATNEHIYRAWNKWWTFSLQLLRDTAQPRIFERTRTGKAIVKPENVFRRGEIFRGGPDDSVEFIGTPPIPLELRSTQLDLEAMMQRGGPSWAMFGNVTGQMTAYVMSQIAASANQVMKPFHQAVIDLREDIGNDIVEDVRVRGVKPYGWQMPQGLTDDMQVSARYEVEIPGDLVQRATVARMLDPDFRLSYTFVMQKLFPEIKNPTLERARTRADIAEQHPANAAVAYIMFCKKQAAYLEKIGDSESARLYELAGEAAEAQLTGMQQGEPGRAGAGGRAEMLPQQNQPLLPLA